MMGTVYSIDPGLTGTGFAIWTQRRLPDKCGVLVTRQDHLADPWPTRVHDFSVRLRRALVPGIIKPFPRGSFAYIEYPTPMESIAGLAASKGAIHKLAFMVGAYAIMLMDRGVTVELVTPVQWKGQLPKKVVEARIRRELGDFEVTRLNVRSHAWDAVGIGLWANGVWK